MGNTCRSPLAQGLSEDVARREGLERGTRGRGLRGLRRNRRLARRLRAQRAGLEDRLPARRGHKPATGTPHRYRALRELRLHPHVGRGELPGGRWPLPEKRRGPTFPRLRHGLPRDGSPEPYYGGLEGFERVLDLVEEASEGLLEDIDRKS